MSKIADLHAFIAALDLVAAEQIDSFVDEPMIKPANRPTGAPGQIVIAEKHYTATFNIERYPHGQVSADLLFAQVAAWLLVNDAKRTKPNDFSMNVDLLDDETANLEFGVEFVEEIILVEDLSGTVNINNRTYSLYEPAL